MGRLKKLLVLLLAALSGGCTGEVDFCELLSVQEAQTLDSSIESKRMATFDDKSNYCVYSNGREEIVFQFSIGNATTNPPFRILETFLPHMKGDNSVEQVFGIGESAAALFFDDEEEDKFRILIANYGEWSITLRAKGIRSHTSDKFT